MRNFWGTSSKTFSNYSILYWQLVESVMVLIRAGLLEEKNSLNLVSYSDAAVLVIILVF